MQASPLTNRGFTLVELMVAMVITLVGLIGLLKALEFAMNQNMTNQLRDEAVHVGEQAMAYQKVRPFQQLSSSNPPQVASRIRNGSVRYTVAVSASPATSQTEKLITVRVGWSYRGQNFSHEVRSLRSVQ